MMHCTLAVAQDWMSCMLLRSPDLSSSFSAAAAAAAAAAAHMWVRMSSNMSAFRQRGLFGW